jgi:hypothetical protein
LRKIACIVAIAALLAWSASLQATDSTRKLYKWVDEQGVVHYGDRIPPEYASQEQHIFNSKGVEVERRDALKSPDQMAADEQKKLDAQERQNRDRNLLNTYVSVQEIERLRDQRLALVSDQMKVTSQFLEILHGRLQKLEANSMHFKPYSSEPNAPRLPDQIADDLVHLHKDIHTQEQNLRQKQSDEAAMRAQFDSDLSRFKDLKGIH